MDVLRFLSSFISFEESDAYEDDKLVLCTPFDGTLVEGEVSVKIFGIAFLIKPLCDKTKPYIDVT